MQAPTRWILIAALGAGALAVAPNALWLARSSAYVHNQAAEPVELRLVIENGTTLVNRLGTLRPGGTRFAWLAPRGEATFFVELRDGSGWQRHCGEYVEGSMYRIEVVVRAPNEVACSTGLPLFDHLMLSDLLS